MTETAADSCTNPNPPGNAGGAKLSLKRKKAGTMSQIDTRALCKKAKLSLVVPKLKREVISKIFKERRSKDSAELDGISSECVEEPDGSQRGQGSSFGEGLGDLFFCHVCQRDLTKSSILRRQQHMNKCCDAAAASDSSRGGSGSKAELSCVVCRKKFSDEQVN